MARHEDHPVILLDDWDNELDFEPQFVGRHKDIELLRNALNGRYRLFGVFGIRAVGKSRLIKELLSHHLTNTADNAPKIIRLDLSNHRSIKDSFRSLCTSLEQFPETLGRNEQEWGNKKYIDFGDVERAANDDQICEALKFLFIQIKNYIRTKRNVRFIFFFDNVENAENDEQLREALMSFFLLMAKNCTNVKIFITSTTKFMTCSIQRVYCCHELLPLRPSESAELFKAIAPNAELGECEGPIVKLSEGLPLLISMIANELADDNGRITPNDMVNMLATSRLKCLSRQDFYAEDDRIADVYRKFIERLQPNDIRRLGQLGYLPDSFDTSQAREFLGFQADYEVEDQVLIPIRRRYMLTYDAQTRRFNIQGILRECLEVYFAIKNITDNLKYNECRIYTSYKMNVILCDAGLLDYDLQTLEVRMKFVKVFTTVMSDLSKKLGTEEYLKALSEFSLEQPNFQKLLTEVYFTTEDTYQFFITVAATCTELIEQFMMKECDKFYKGCLVMADRYGNEMDKAVVNIAVGSMWTNAKGDFHLGANYYRQALKVLTPKGNRLQLATAYQGLGANLFAQGKNLEAVGYFRNAFKLSQNGGPKFQNLTLQSSQSIGVTNIVLCNFEEADNFLFMALKRTRASLKNHPMTAKALNSIGVFYAAKGDSENALQYYKEGLEVKRRTKASVTQLALSINNVATEYSALKMYDNAYELLDEGFQIINSQEIPSQAVLALLYNTKGKILMSEKRYSEAVDMFEKAADIRESIVPEHIGYIGTLVHLAVAKKCVGLYSSSIKIANKALSVKEKAKDPLPPNPFITECYECLADVYMKMGNDKNYSDTLEQLQWELRKLEQVHMCSCNDIKVEQVKKQLVKIREKLSAINKKECQIETIYSRTRIPAT